MEYLFYGNEMRVFPSYTNSTEIARTHTNYKTDSYKNYNGIDKFFDGHNRFSENLYGFFPINDFKELGEKGLKSFLVTTSGFWLMYDSETGDICEDSDDLPSDPTQIKKENDYENVKYSKDELSIE